MAISKQRRVLPVGALFQNEPHLRLHTLTLARNANFNWAEFVAINGGIGLRDGEPIDVVIGEWPDNASFLARTERPNYAGTDSPWIVGVQGRNCTVLVSFPDLSIGPIEVLPYSATWTFGAVEIELPVQTWHRFVITIEDVEPGAQIAWMVWGERPLLAADLVPPSSSPAFTTPPGIFGTGEVGQTLTCVPGVASGFPAPAFSFQWYQAPSTAIVGATAFQYVVQAGDAGLDLFCEVTATNTAGSASADSNSISIASGATNNIVTSTGDALVTSTGDNLVWS